MELSQIEKEIESLKQTYLQNNANSSRNHGSYKSERKSSMSERDPSTLLGLKDLQDITSPGLGSGTSSGAIGTGGLTSIVGKLKDYSNEELEKLIKQKNQNLENLQGKSLFSNSKVSSHLANSSQNMAYNNNMISNTPPSISPILPNNNISIANYQLSNNTGTSNFGPKAEIQAESSVFNLSNQFKNEYQSDRSTKVLPNTDNIQFNPDNNMSFNNNNNNNNNSLQSSGNKPFENFGLNGIKENDLILKNTNAYDINNPYLQNLSGDTASSFSGMQSVKSDPMLVSLGNMAQNGSMNTESNKIDIPSTRNKFDSTRSYSSNKELYLSSTPSFQNNTDYPISSTSGTATMRSRSKESSAVANAMKALQDRVKSLEEENVDLRNKLVEGESAKAKQIESLRGKLLQDQKEGIEREKTLKNNLNDLNNELNKLKLDLSNAKSVQIKHENEINTLKNQNAKYREDLLDAKNECLILKKEISILENEKERHIEQNATDCDQFERKIDGIAAKLKGKDDYIFKLEKEIKILNSEKLDLQDKLTNIISENTLYDEKVKQKIEDLEKRNKDLAKKNQEYHNLNIELEEKIDHEKMIGQKKIVQLEEKAKSLAKVYEEQINLLGEENKQLKRVNKEMTVELNRLRLRLEKLEKLKHKPERDRKDIDDDINPKYKVRANGSGSKNRKRDVANDDEIVKPTNSGMQNKSSRYAISHSYKSGFKSRSSSRSQSKGPKKLSVDDLNTTNEDMLVRSSARKKSDGRNSHKGNIDTNSSLTISESKQNTPRRILTTITHTSANKSTRNVKSNDINDKIYIQKNDLLRKPLDNAESLLSSSQSRSGLGNGLISLSKSSLGRNDDNALYESSISNNAANMNTKVPTPSEIEKMIESEISNEIVKVERIVSELKREYKNLLSKTQQTELTENMPEIRARMNIVASELQSKSEIHILLKKKQKELIHKESTLAKN